MHCVEYQNSTYIDFSPTKRNECITLLGNDHSPFNVSLAKGTYKIELWGAAGGASVFYGKEGGNGGYSSGLLTLQYNETFFFFIGTKGGDSYNISAGAGGYNGGADGGIDNQNEDCPSGGSGGSTDMRINESISGRIIVAGGGGSGGCYTNSGKGGHGGGIFGIKGEDNINKTAFGGEPGTQNTGYLPLYGQKGTTGGEAGGSGGGGYWGGFAGNATDDKTNNGGGAGGGGGSSFISGHPNCSSIEQYIFANPVTLSGAEPMPSNSSSHETVEGNHGNGSVRITCFNNIITYSHSQFKNHISILCMAIMIAHSKR